ARVDEAVSELVEVENADDQHAERGKVEEKDAPRQAGKDVMAEEAPERHRQLRQVHRRKIQRPLGKGRWLLDLGVDGHPQSNSPGDATPRETDTRHHTAFRSYRSHRRRL